MKGVDPISLAVLLAALALVPLFLIVTTAFLKIAVVLMLVRNALGVQQVPPNVAVYALALVLSLYVMAPVFNRMSAEVQANPQSLQAIGPLMSTASKAAEPLRGFLSKHADADRKKFFLESVQRLWPPEDARNVSEQDYLVLMPAFVVSQLSSAFEVGFLLYLPFVVIDLVVSNILLALGMMMVSPSTISLPIKLFLFVMVDGWTRLMQGLVLSYV